MGWLLLPIVAVMEFFDLRRGLDGQPALVSAYLVGFCLLTLLCLPWLPGHLRRMRAEVRWMVVAFLVMMGWALATALVLEPPVAQRIQVSRGVLVVPVLTAVLTMLAALSFSAVIRRVHLWSTGWVVLVCSVANWPRAVRVHNSSRISTGMGGAAIYHVVLLTTLAIFLGCAVAGYRRVASTCGAAVAALLIVAVGSRAGLGCLVLFAALLAVWALQQGLGKWVGRVAVVAAAVLGLLVAFVPWLQRLMLLSEPRRQQNLTLALEVWRESAHNVVLGVGSGQLWPWYALDIKMIPAPGGLMIKTQWGLVLNSPHSTYLAVLVELGLVGFAVLLAFLAMLVVTMLRLWKGGSALALMTAMALVASLGAFLFDTYLLKNFGVSFWWWLVLFAAVASPAESA